MSPSGPSNKPALEEGASEQEFGEMGGDGAGGVRQGVPREGGLPGEEEGQSATLRSQGRGLSLPAWAPLQQNSLQVRPREAGWF